MGTKKLFGQLAPTTSQAQWQHIRWSQIKKATSKGEPTCQKDAHAEYRVNGETHTLRKTQQPPAPQQVSREFETKSEGNSELPGRVPAPDGTN
eukprot:scaffold59297_cov60-Attheya_sp.AAC.2